MLSYLFPECNLVPHTPQDQVNLLTRKLKETEDMLSQEKYLKSKLQEEQTNLLGEKSNLNGKSKVR